MALFSAKRLPLVLHIGLTETGTSALQRTLFGRRDALREAGIVVPLAGRRGDAHHELAWHFGFHAANPPEAKMSAEAIADAWHAEISQTPRATGVVTSELLSLPGRHAELNALLSERFEIRVVVHLHRHDLWLPLIYARSVRSTLNPKWGRGYEAFLNFRKAHGGGRSDAFRPIVDAWAALVGKEKVIVRPYEASQIGDNIAADLLRSIGATAEAQAAVATPVKGDAPLTLEALNYIDVLMHTTLPPDVKRFLVLRCLQHDPGTNPASPLASAGLRSGQIALHYDDYEYIANRYLGRSDGILFRDPTPTSEAVAWKPPAFFTNMWFAEQLCATLGQADVTVLAALRGFTPAAVAPAPAPAPAPKPKAGDA